MPISGQSLLKELRAMLVKFADPTKAPQMQAYMKSKLPFHGVIVPNVRTISHGLFKPLKFTDFDELAAAVKVIWHGAKFREERYGALRLLDTGKKLGASAKDRLNLLEELIVSGAWWDLVDDIAAHMILPLLKSDPEVTKKRLRRWSRSPDFWLRRSAIIAQVLAGKETDAGLLFEVIEPSIGEKEFFLRKAIGWSLRALAKVNPEAVIGWLDQYGDRASGLTKREAQKGLAAAEKMRGAASLRHSRSR